jgi:hypothetical protein
LSDAVVTAALAPLLALPDVTSELVSQAPLGALLAVEETGGEWLRVRGDDRYPGWIHQGYLLRGDHAELAAWREDAHLASLGAVLSLGGQAKLAIPLGARLAPAPDGRVRLPDGRVAAVAGGRVAPVGELVVEALAMPLAAWARVFFAGAPYLWGGLTPWGVDSSGLVQTSCRMRGVLLPRDAHRQARAGQPVPAADLGYRFAPGDLLFFAEPAPNGPAGKAVAHAAIADGEGGVVHATLAAGGVCTSPLSGGSPEAARLRASFVCARRLG